MRIVKHLSTLASLLFLAYSATAQCPNDYYRVRLEIQPDEYYDEISWRIATLDGAVVYANGFCADTSFQVFNYCIPNTNTCLALTMYDIFEDGIEEPGYYKLFVNDSLLRTGGRYRALDKTSFGCPIGAFCSNPLPIDTGAFTTPSGNDAWYRYDPPVTGTYRLSTCKGNACDTKIWVYDHCENLAVNSNQAGAIFYAQDGCAGGASATLFLAGGKTYFFRIGYAPGICTGPIQGRLSYQGAVKGCTDPNACNYNPLATIPDTCLYPGDPNCTFAPDLAIDGDELKESIVLDTIQNPTQCAIEEGCLRGFGLRNVIRFSTHILNIGNQDYYIGTPPLDPSTPSNQFVWDPCHQHWHYRGYAEYILMTSNQQTPIGTKNGFCVLDLQCTTGNGKYTCEQMGITPGCSDTYDIDLDCQWVDITGLEAGVYALGVRVNWNRKPDTLGRIERNYDNNWAQVCFRLSYNGSIPVLSIIDSCENYRDCLGVPLGNAQPDCEGVCNGPARYGDWNRDGQRTIADVEAYTDAAYTRQTALTNCNNLYADTLFSLMDAGVLQECVLHAGDATYWGQRFSCSFPVLPDNTDGSIFLYPGQLDTLNRTFEVRALNSLKRIMGLDFTINGLQIDSVVSLSKDFRGKIRFDDKGHIQMWSYNEQTMEKHLVAEPILKIYYKKTTANRICLTNFREAVNQRYKPMRTVITTNACVDVPLTTRLSEPTQYNPTVTVQPNPLRAHTTFLFDNPPGEYFDLSVFDLTGHLVHQATRLYGDQYEWETGGLAAGVYWYELRTARGNARGRLIVQ